MRHRPRIDANHVEIVKALRRVGASVQSLAGVGKGCPDLLVGFRDENFLIEVKDGTAKDKRQRTLTDDEDRWIAEWRGSVEIALSVAQALAIIGIRPYRDDPAEQLGKVLGESLAKCPK